MGIGIFWFVFAIAVGVYASNKGRSGIGWFVLSVLISPLLGFVFCVACKDLSIKAQPASPSLATHRKCPSCAEFILPEAIVCKHCGSNVEPDKGFANRKMAEAQIKDTKESISMLAAVAALIFGVASIAMMNKCVG